MQSAAVHLQDCRYGARAVRSDLDRDNGTRLVVILTPIGVVGDTKEASQGMLEQIGLGWLEVSPEAPLPDEGSQDIVESEAQWNELKRKVIELDEGCVPPPPSLTHPKPNLPSSSDPDPGQLKCW